LYKYEQKATPALGQPAISQLDRCGPRLPGDGTDTCARASAARHQAAASRHSDQSFRTPGISQQDLADKLLVGRSNLSMLLPQMEKRGLLVRRGDPQDRRVLRLELTPSGTESDRGNCHPVRLIDRTMKTATRRRVQSCRRRHDPDDPGTDPAATSAQSIARTEAGSERKKG
jgi:hypothetical protein